MKYKNIIFVFIFIFTIKFSFSQQFIRIDSLSTDSLFIDTINLESNNFQFTVFYPLGTNWGKTYFINKLSLNLLFGVEGALNGTEIGLIGNHNTYFTSGNQIACLVNSCGGVQDGMQISLLYNRASIVNGKQIGFINVCDTLYGKQIGFINVNQNASKNFELWANESFYFNMGYKVGTPNLYKIVSIGLQPFGGKFKTALGIGIGKELSLKENKFKNLELLLLQVNENEMFTKKLNTIASLRFNYGKEISSSSRVYAGLNMNLMFSNFYNSANKKFGSDVSPWPIVDTEIIKDKMNFLFWPGISFGMSFY
ncbi:MAG: hypothetical protein K9J13_02660 [Saprospiraceae bacterium]|nr:hypothetical protein [Saprospiraceae bacterium]